jgi:hypothetical protein
MSSVERTFFRGCAEFLRGRAVVLWRSWSELDVRSEPVRGP